MARLLMILTYVAGAVGIALAFYELGDDSKLALTIDHHRRTRS